MVMEKIAIVNVSSDIKDMRIVKKAVKYNITDADIDKFCILYHQKNNKIRNIHGR